MAISNEELLDLVDVDRGSISGRIFTDQEIYDREIRDIFHHTWQFLAHESQIPKAGDFFSTYIGEDPILVVRQRDGSVRAFLNACRHRGMRACRADFGNVKAFTCTYHGWTYDLAGRLVNVPNLEDSYHNELDTTEWGLVQVPLIDDYRGFYFGNFDTRAPSLLGYIGPMAWWLDNLLDRWPEGAEVTGSVNKLVFPANWKLAAEQFCGDEYHAPMTHVSVFSSPDGPANSIMIGGNAEDTRQWSSRLGHGIVSFSAGDGPKINFDRLRERGDDVLANYYQRVTQSYAERVGPHHPIGIGTIFPNFTWQIGVQLNTTITVWHPKGPNSMQQWRFVIVDKAASEEEKRVLNRSTQVWPLGLADSDDSENWGAITKNVASSPAIQDMRFNYQMGLGHERDDDPQFHPGRVGYGACAEGSHRSFYRRWLDFLLAHGDEWPHVSDKHYPELEARIASRVRTT